jgi:glycosyltransferase involved in cell wall biosynthesis
MNKKILFLLHLPPPIHGSSVVGKQILDSQLINNKFDCEYINISTSSQIDKIGKYSINKFFKFFKILFRIFNTLLFNKIDKIYLAPTVSKKGLYKDYLIILILKFFKVKKFYHLHNKGVSKRVNNKFLNLLYVSFFKNAKIILLSERLFSDVSEFVKREDVFICPNGIKNEIDDTIQKNNGKDIIELLFLSNLISSKGVVVLLKACEILLKKDINFICNFVGAEGDVSKEKFNEIVCELKLEKKAFYLGKKYGLDKKNIFLKSDIFVFPTYYHNETFGLVNLEAMMHGLPVISTDEGGIPDVVINNKTGFIIEKKNSKVLAEKIEILINDAVKRNSMGAAGRKRFVKKFSVKTFEDRLSVILDK